MKNIIFGLILFLWELCSKTKLLLLFHHFLTICFVLECIEMNEGLLLTSSPILIVIGLVHIELCNENSSSHIPVANWLFRGLKCEAVRSRFLVMAQLACIPANLIIYSMPELLSDICHACMHKSCIPNTTLLEFMCDANHISMTSFGFTFDSHYIHLVWHDIIGIHIV